MFNSKLTLVHLGKELGRGGEGAVFDVAGRPDVVAKLYHKIVRPDHASKLKVMVSMANERLARIAAWPLDTLQEPNGDVVGFLMPRVSGHQPVFQLYGPKLRLQEFPRADWRFLIHAAANAARSFSVVHSHGFVMGDVNHGNLVVSQDGTVRLWDCDSFQVTRGNEIWYCPVGVGTHQPPEMQGVASYLGIRRTPNHDNFGLAVIIFQLLCMARHPFAGRFLGSGDPPSIEDAIAKSRYAYSRDQTRTQLAPPPISLPMDAMSARIRNMFEQAFSPSAIQGGRPLPEHWVAALEELSAELRPCSINHGHYHLKGLSRCPWCDIEAVSGVPLFPAVFVNVSGRPDGMVALWQELNAQAEPPPLTPLPSLTLRSGKPSDAALADGRRTKLLRRSAYVLTAAASVSCTIIAPTPAGLVWGGFVFALCLIAGREWANDKAGSYRKKLEEVTAEWENLKVDWSQPLGRDAFSQKKAQLTDIKLRYDALNVERVKRLQQLSKRNRQSQLDSYLDRYLVATAGLKGVGQSKVATLSSYGIDTAGDIDARRIFGIPGFGRKTVDRLVAWRRQIEQGFTFDPAKAVPPNEIAKIEHFVLTQRVKLENEMAEGLNQLKIIASASQHRKNALLARADHIRPRIEQALADASAAPVNETATKRMLIASGLLLALIVLIWSGRPPHSSTQLTLSTSGSVTRPAPNSLPSSNNQIPTQSSPSSSQPRTPAPQGVLSLQPAGPKMEQSENESDQTQKAVSDILRRLLPPSSSETAASNKRPTVTAAPLQRVATRQGANVREAPNGSATVVRTVSTGIVLSVFSRVGGWVQVGERDPWGWIHSSLLEPAP